MVEAMEIQKGFKQTEVGVIPGDWCVKKLKEVANIRRGASPRPINDPKWFSDNGRGWVRISDVTSSNVYLNSTTQYLSEDGVRNSVAVDKGALIMSICATIGIPIIINIPACIHDGFVFFKNYEKELETFYLYFFLQKQTEILTSKGQPGTQKNLNTTIVGNIDIAYPTKAEQTAIATALNDADALITQLEKLIAKKRNIKQGAMQELLTGKKRLMGFNGKWDIKTLGDVCDIKTGKKDVNQGNPNGYYPFFTCSRESTYSDEYSFDGEAILIAGNGEVGNLHYYVGKFEAYQRTYVLQNFTVGTNYLWYQLLAFFKKSLGIGTIGSSIPYIKMENIAEFIFSTPKEESEQTAIAQILSDMDTEIEALENKLYKYKMIKQGMMQVLLTGKVRLI